MVNLLLLATSALLAISGAQSFEIDVRFTNAIPETAPGVKQAVEEAFRKAAARWGEIITTKLTPVTFTSERSFSQCRVDSTQATPTFAAGDGVRDLTIFSTIKTIDGEGKVLGAAAPCVSDRAGFSRIGLMYFDIDDLKFLYDENLLDVVIIHEMGHVLGLGTKWSGKVNSAFEYTGSRSRTGQAAVGGTGPALIENEGGQGTRGGHWRDAFYKNELMTGYVNKGFNPISKLTLAGLQDLGFTVNENSADAYNVNDLSADRESVLAKYGDDILKVQGQEILEADGTVSQPEGESSFPVYAVAGGAAGVLLAVAGVVVARRNRQGASTSTELSGSVVGAPQIVVQGK